ncbi:guanosine-3',5'-bis(diphosphate) 3'-pyrophosphohydrolase MESH1-like [Ornithodoros turicata]|uniref:guanosine-3',5'-bis(diphosphate) 3'-pyrophosphohydrolase MESH1-like n=1 Tax=Ornithodoros turicata TaxID=34597 RepID=UPI00313A0E01
MESSQNQCALLVEAVDFAAIRHRNQRRKDKEGTPYINHPIGVARILTAEGKIFDITTLQAAVLHDIVEDTDTTFEEIEKIFGKKVRDILAEVTDDKTQTKQMRKQLQIENASKCSYEARLIKLADKLYILRDLHTSTPEGWSERKVQEYFDWAKKVVEGLRGTNKDIEAELDKLFNEHNSPIESVAL